MRSTKGYLLFVLLIILVPWQANAGDEVLQLIRGTPDHPCPNEFCIVTINKTTGDLRVVIDLDGDPTIYDISDIDPVSQTVTLKVSDSGTNVWRTYNIATGQLVSEVQIFPEINDQDGYLGSSYTLPCTSGSGTNSLKCGKTQTLQVISQQLLEKVRMQFITIRQLSDGKQQQHVQIR